jgi:hypothetical protein
VRVGEGRDGGGGGEILNLRVVEMENAGPRPRRV